MYSSERDKNKYNYNDTSSRATETSRNNDNKYDDNDNSNKTVETPRNSNSTYNHTFTDSNGAAYQGISSDGYAFGVIKITKQKEIYCDFGRSPRASGMFHIVEFAVGNGRNEQILQG